MRGLATESEVLRMFAGPPGGMLAANQHLEIYYVLRSFRLWHATDQFASQIAWQGNVCV